MGSACVAAWLLEQVPLLGLLEQVPLLVLLEQLPLLGLLHTLQKSWLRCLHVLPCPSSSC